METILIVEDELIIARGIRKILERSGHHVIGVVRTVEKALESIYETKPSLVLIDIYLKGEQTGIDLAHRLNKEDIPFIYISANSNQPTLEAAKTTNPYGFIVKPFREKDLLVTIDIARYRYTANTASASSSADPMPHSSHPGPHSSDRTPHSSDRTPHPTDNSHYPTPSHAHIPSPHEGLVGSSAPMLQVYDLIQKVSHADTSVLILGETGTGKELIANSIHRQSPRSDKPFIKVNCAAIPAGLIETELFGYEKGAFTGAIDKKMGKFEQANGGTILLDEIGEMPIGMQAQLLRVLQEKEIQRIGSHQSIKINVRILAATNRHLEKEVAEGRFRLDLYYRLLVFPISLPPLRQRKEDIPLLTRHFINYYADKLGKKITNIEDRLLQRLIDYPWPGNVRELQHLIERTILLSTDDTIRSITFPDTMTDTRTETLTPISHQQDALQPTTPKTQPFAANANPSDNLATPNGISEKDHLLSILKKCNFKITGKGGAAELLNVSPGFLHRKIKKLGITKNYYF